MNLLKKNNSKNSFYLQSRFILILLFCIFLFPCPGFSLTYERLTTDGADEQDPVYSPDGSKVAYADNVNGKYAIYVMNTDGSGDPVLVYEHASYDLRSPSWSPDGSELIWNTSSYYAFRAPSDGSGTPVQIGSFRPQSVDWSPDGSKIAYHYGNLIYIANSDGMKVTSIVNGYYPRWSPDGSRITYYYSNRVYVKEVDGDGDGLQDGTGAVTDIALDGKSYYSSWSPDGTKIVFISTRDAGNGWL